MGVVGMLMSILFRLQLSNPGESFAVLEWFLGEKWAPGGVLDPNMYLALVTMHGTILIFWVLTAGLTGTFANFLIPLQIGARDMASGFINMLSYWFFFAATVVLLTSLFVETGPAAAGWTIFNITTASRIWFGTGLVVNCYDIIYCIFVVGRFKLYCHNIKS